MRFDGPAERADPINPMERAALAGQGYDRVTQASMNSLYVKAQELDRGHNEKDAPSMAPPGFAGLAGQSADAESHASAVAPDAESHASTRAPGFW